ASRAVGVAQQLLSAETRTKYVTDLRADYARIANAHAKGQEKKQRLTLRAARANALPLDFTGAAAPTRPTFLGTRSLQDYPLADLAQVIDWTPFFSTWELTGQYPAILTDSRYGQAATALFNDAQAMLEKIVTEKWFTANAVFGFWPANREGDDVILYTDDTRSKELTRLHTLRQQLTKRDGKHNAALADFVAPRDGGVPDYVGAFVVTAGIGEDVIADRFKHANDDYSSILCKALADRLAEAFAERLHQRVRTEFWRYAPDEALANADLIGEKYRGIRPAPGYPAQPDHTEKRTIFSLLDGERAAGVTLTESCAMWPGSSVSGLYFAHPDSYYFGVGKIERDQVEDYAQRKGWTIEEAERWLAPILNYDPNLLNIVAAE
ncbi:MAG TPA: vitamin B12 dependent-methionine synthase activation domain-containing protein, partial [Pseudolabrys sp.]